jgi:hypothetical protein
MITMIPLLTSLLPSFRQFKAASKKELEGYLNALDVPFSEGTLKAALISALQEALKE